MDKIILITNAITFSLTFVLLEKKMNNDIRKIYPLLLVIFIVEIIFKFFWKEYSKVSWYINAVIISIWINQEQKNIVKSFNCSILALCIIQSLITVVGSFAVLVLSIKDTMTSIPFNIVIQLCLIGFAIFFYKIDLISLMCPKDKVGLKLSLLYNFLLFIYLNFIMPYFFLRIGLRMYCLISLIFIIFDVLTKIFLMVINEKDSELKLKEKELQLLRSNYKNIEKKDFEIVKIKDFTSQMATKFIGFLNNKDNAGIVSYFDEKVTPTYVQYLEEKTMFKQVGLINEPLIKGLVYEFLHNLSEKREISVKLDIMQNSNIPEKKLLVIHRAMELFLNDAYEELIKTNTGHTHLKLFNDAETFKFSLDNFLGKNIKYDSNQLIKKDSILKDFIKRNADIIELNTINDSGFFLQRMTVSLNE